MTDQLVMAEECIDRHARAEDLDGQSIEIVTGQVLLHAVDTSGHCLCGRDADHLTTTERPWRAAYLPHVRRCLGCLSARPGDGPEGYEHDPGPRAPASDVEIRTAHGADAELAAAAVLRAVLDEHDLRRWMLTDVVIIDESIVGGFSHPLTLSPPRLRRPALALTTFLHEQLHWLEGLGAEQAMADAKQRWPDPPGPPAGCLSAESTWLHMSVCTLEYQSLAEIVGSRAAAEELTQHRVYSWIYSQILADPAWFTDYLDRHGLRAPSSPPVPHRYFGEVWWS
jgi:hypothetical protein